MTHAQALVHVIDADPDVQQQLTRWLNSAGIATAGYAHLGAFLDAQRPDVPGCVIIDAQRPSICGFEAQVILLPLAVRCPIVVAACQAGIEMATRAASTGVIGFVRKPLLEREVVAAISGAVEVDRARRLVEAERAEWRRRFATLSPRERQVMALVTTGRLNKQVAGELGLSEITVKAHRGAAMRKMDARSLAQLVRMADVIGVEPALPVRTGSSRSIRTGGGVDRHSGYSHVSS